MKKFKKSIEISTENISDVLQVPIVTSVYKTKFFKDPFIEGRINPYDVLVVMYVHIEGIKSDLCINHGDFLVIGFCDTWYVFSKEWWEKHKHDEILRMDDISNTVTAFIQGSGGCISEGI